MLELFNLVAQEDSDSYTLKEFDPKSWKLKTVGKIAPLIHSQSNAYHGVYWGDTRGILLTLQFRLKATKDK